MEGDWAEDLWRGLRAKDSDLMEFGKALVLGRDKVSYWCFQWGRKCELLYHYSLVEQA